MVVDHGCFDIIIIKHFLYDSNVITILEQMAGKAASEVVGVDSLCDFHLQLDGSDLSIVHYVERISLMRLKFGGRLLL